MHFKLLSFMTIWYQKINKENVQSKNAGTSIGTSPSRMAEEGRPTVGATVILSAWLRKR